VDSGRTREVGTIIADEAGAKRYFQRIAWSLDAGAKAEGAADEIASRPVGGERAGIGHIAQVGIEVYPARDAIGETNTRTGCESAAGLALRGIDGQR
jgi:hypothetical protein